MVDITVVIPTIPPRKSMLDRALRSVEQQNVEPKDIIVVKDVNGYGPSWARNKGMKEAKTKYVAFLDDDDEMLPNHIEELYKAAVESNAAWTYSHNEDISKLPKGIFQHFQSNKDLTSEEIFDGMFLPVTSMVIKNTVLKVGGFPLPPEPEVYFCEEQALQIKLAKIDAVWKHVPKTTWIWHHHGKNTSGKSWKKMKWR